MNQLTEIEAERVNHILNHATNRLQILAHVPLVWDDDIVVELKTQGVLNALEKLWMCEEQLGDRDFMLSGIKSINMTKDVHRSARGVCRNLNFDRDSLQTIMTQVDNKSDNIMKFVATLNEFRSQMLNRLTTTVEVCSTSLNHHNCVFFLIFAPFTGRD
jgi:hypothetical protein